MSSDTEYGSGANYHKVRFDIALQRIATGMVPSEFCCVADPNVPDCASYLELWAKDRPDLTKRLNDAKLLGAKAMLADCVRIATDRRYRVDERKLMIETRKYLAALWNAECNPKTVIEQTSTINLQTPREEYVKQTVALLGIDAQQAGAMYDRMAIH